MKSSSLTRCLAALLLTCAAARADFQNGQHARLALGELGPNQDFAGPSGVAVDPVTHKVFIADRIKNRVLRFSSAESLKNGGGAEAVLGQPGFDTGFASNSTATGMSGPEGISVGSDGRLWVADEFNNRVLRFDNAATIASGSAADGVLGQATFTGHDSAGGPAGMFSPRGVAVDAGGSLWVADTANNRVLRFDAAATRAPGAPADGVLGQTNFFDSTPGTSPASFRQPGALAMDHASGSLWVADTLNHRVLMFVHRPEKPNGVVADEVLGQLDAYQDTAGLAANRMNHPAGLAIEDGVVWVSDSNNNRVLRFNNAANKPGNANADGVLGQALFTTDSVQHGPAGLYQPAGLAADNGQLWIADAGFERVLRHQAAAGKPSGSNADGVTGKRTMDTSSSGSQPNLLGENPGGIAIDPVSGKVFVCDTANNRVLRFAAGSALVSGAAAEFAFGQPDLTSSQQGSGEHGLNQPLGVAMDHLGHLWIADTQNNRVLRISNAATVSSSLYPGTTVFGQYNFSNEDPATSPAGMNRPSALAVESTFNGTLQTWSTSRLWVADTYNSRVLRFDAPLSDVDGIAASRVLGQSSFFMSGAASLATGMSYPQGIAIDGSGRLWVADTLNHRVLRFDAASAKATGAAADGLLLQPAFGIVNAGPAAALGNFPGGVCVTPQGRLFVADRGNRVVWFNNAASLPSGTVIHGMLGFTGNIVFPTPTNPHAWNNLLKPSACALDDVGRLWVVDGGHARVLRFSPALDSTITGTGLDAQNHFTLTVRASRGETCEIRSSPDLQDWSTLDYTFRTSAIGLAFSTFTWTVPTAASGQRFYRLQAP